MPQEVIYIESVYLYQFSITHMRSKIIGMVFQNYALFPHMTVTENLLFPLQVRKIPKADAQEKVQQALNMVQMSGLHPQNAFVAQFIGENKRLIGKVVQETGDLCSVELEEGGRVQALIVKTNGVGSQPPYP